MIWWHLATAGIGKLIFHWGIGIGAIIVLLLLEIFTQELGVIPLIGPVLVAFLAPLRKDLLWAAGCIGICMIVYGIGVKDEANRCSAKGQFVQTTVDKAVRRAVAPHAHGVRDKFNDAD